MAKTQWEKKAYLGRKRASAKYSPSSVISFCKEVMAKWLIHVFPSELHYRNGVQAEALLRPRTIYISRRHSLGRTVL